MDNMHRARELLLAIAERSAKKEAVFHHTNIILTEAIAAALSEAKQEGAREEREACAKLASARADEYDASYEGTKFRSLVLAGQAALTSVAAAIRARKP